VQRIALSTALFIACSSEGPHNPPPDPSAPAGGTIASLTVTSTAFADQSPIPPAFTCDDANGSPPLAWSDPPPTAQGFAIVALDLTATGPNEAAPFVHWVLYGLPATARSVPAIAKGAPSGDHDGRNDFGGVGYGGPCPPPGEPHSYVFTVWALDVSLPDLGAATRDALYVAMDRHVVAKGSLQGLYQRP
jgi:Raf kinase inhibitor-like YbhB/YbcL family protein